MKFSFVDVQKLLFNKISTVAQSALESEDKNHQEAAELIQRLLDMLNISLGKKRNTKPSSDIIVNSDDLPF